jgi:hypothetical protein
MHSPGSPRDGFLFCLSVELITWCHTNQTKYVTGAPVARTHQEGFLSRRIKKTTSNRTRLDNMKILNCNSEINFFLFLNIVLLYQVCIKK